MQDSSILGGHDRWITGGLLKSGGFGKVFEARREAETAYAFVAKFVPKEPGAERELLFQQLTGVRNVVPVIDVAETPDHYVLIMPRAKHSLDEVIRANGPLDPKEALAVLIDVASALSDIEGVVVHRDLKPANILLLDGAWCLADFGIARYAEASTSPETRKFAMSAAYAAPEQWRFERATSATDVYAFGVIMFQLLTGHIPFPGPVPADFRHQHIHVAPPDDPSIPAEFRILIAECMYKAAQSRKSAHEVLARLLSLAAGNGNPSPGQRELRDAARSVAAAALDADRALSADRSELSRRRELISAAESAFDRVDDALRTTLTQAAPNGSLSQDDHGWTFSLGKAALRLLRPIPAPGDPWNCEPRPDFDVIATASLRLHAENDAGSQSRSLWYCDFGEAGRYRWCEFAFNGTMELTPDRPFHLAPGPAAARAFEGGPEYWLDSHTVGIEQDDAGFVTAWAGRLAQAAVR